MSRNPAYFSWYHMKLRCTDPKHHRWSCYGGRGITFCDTWNIFENFIKDMGPRPPGTQLNRINNDLGYFKENCEWATPKENSNNRRTCRYIEYNGKTKTLQQWSENLKIHKNTLRQRLNRGLSMDDIINNLNMRFP